MRIFSSWFNIHPHMQWVKLIATLISSFQLELKTLDNNKLCYPSFSLSISTKTSSSERSNHWTTLNKLSMFNSMAALRGWKTDQSKQQSHTSGDYLT